MLPTQTDVPVVADKDSQSAIHRLLQRRHKKAIEDAVIAVKKSHIPIDDVAREYGVDKSEIESRLHPAPAVPAN